MADYFGQTIHHVFILKLFFFPNYLGKFDNDSEKEEHVSGELIQRAITP